MSQSLHKISNMTWNSSSASVWSSCFQSGTGWWMILSDQYFLFLFTLYFSINRSQPLFSHLWLVFNTLHHIHFDLFEFGFLKIKFDTPYIKYTRSYERQRNDGSNEDLDDIIHFYVKTVHNYKVGTSLTDW